MKHVRVTFRTDGTTEWDYNGYPGDTCTQAHGQVLRAIKAKGVDLDLSATVSTPKVADPMEDQRQKETV